ncbi:transcriptional regulator [Pseudomonas costantinii]|uniref:transcriptional regulator n=1 Tax=Pseudomonas costantinii TaxID=168469 RepID=UPI0015A1A425|nr:transcriptional regulator [Pseudomonas costantinii]NVZ22662.1 transcriptional regulator [Pseudomonas costantinii]
MSSQMHEWLKTAATSERNRVATLAGTSVGYLYQIAGGHRRASLELSKKLQIATGGDLSMSGLRPDLYELLIESSPQVAA